MSTHTKIRSYVILFFTSYVIEYGSTFHTRTVQKGPHPKLGMMGGRKPAANASATCASAPKAAVGTAKALGPPAGAKYTYAERRTAAQTLLSHTSVRSHTFTNKWKAVESHLSLICLRMVREKPGTSPCCMDAGWYQGSVKVVSSRERWVLGQLAY